LRSLVHFVRVAHAATPLYSLSLHDALPITRVSVPVAVRLLLGGSGQEATGALEAEAREQRGDDDEDDGGTGCPLHTSFEGGDGRLGDSMRALPVESRGVLEGGAQSVEPGLVRRVADGRMQRRAEDEGREPAEDGGAHDRTEFVGGLRDRRGGP